MKRVRKNTTFSLFPDEKVKRTRKNNTDEDPFISINKGKEPLTILKEFLTSRKEYIETHYKDNDRFITLFELGLYEDVLNRIIKSIKK